MQNKHKLIFDAIGTRWQIDFYLQGQALKIKETVRVRIEEFDRCYSRFRSDSLVARWSKKAGTYTLPRDGAVLLDFYKKLYDVSNGLVTPLIGRALEQAGYDASYSLKPKKISPTPVWNESLLFTGWQPVNKENVVKYSLVMKRPVVLDFGAAGKGYLVDIIAEILKDNNIERFCINAGGDIFTHNLSRTIGLEDPDDVKRVLGTIKINNQALCSSAGNRRKWAGYHHIINPRTLKSPKKVKATWVTAENTMLADGIATALFFVPPALLLETFSFEYAMIEGDDMTYSQQFKAEFFTN